MKCAKLACFFSGYPSIGLLVLRVPIGIIFMAHGAQKLFGAYGGDGLQATAEFMATLHMGPGIFLAILVGAVEFFGGLMLVLGLLTRLAALALSIDMLVAIAKVHFPHGLFAQNGGYEFALSLLAASLALLISGPGCLACDRLVRWHCNRKAAKTQT